MCSPVTAADGHSYERSAIEGWLSKHDSSPVTGARLGARRVVANHTLRNGIDEYFDQIASSSSNSVPFEELSLGAQIGAGESKVSCST